MELNSLILENGFRIIHLPALGEVEYFGMFINAGSRDEPKGYEGLAHFVEHTIFKGTERRKSTYILNRIENIGGELNAYTTKEETAIYTISPYGNLKRAVTLVSDIISNSIFPENEIRKEKFVVEEELLSYLDTPAEDIYDKFDSFAFKGSSLAHNILGSDDSLKRFNRELCLQWLATKFTPRRSVLFYMGRENSRKVFNLISEHFANLDRNEETIYRKKPANVIHFHETIGLNSLHQCHNLFGMRVPGIYSEKRPALALISNLLGGPGLNSILNIEMREKRGLVYSVESSLSSYTDCGLLTIYYGCDRSEEERCKEILRKTLDKIHQKGLSEAQVNAAKRQFIGQMILSHENHEQHVLSSARSMLHKNIVYSLEENIGLIKSIDRDCIMEILEDIKFDNLSSLTMKDVS
ncbi:MAG: insulinase family protein [Paramuribaculum sp.]|nr:insulinase family protein [Paramuribaculum sp.]